MRNKAKVALLRRHTAKLACRFTRCVPVSAMLFCFVEVARVVAPLVMAMSLLVHLLLQILLNVTSSTVCLFWCTHCYKVTSPEQQ